MSNLLTEAGMPAKNLKLTSVTFRPEQIVAVDDVKARLQKVTPDESVSRSDVIRDAVDKGLPLVEKEVSEREADLVEEAAAGMSQMTAGP
jgi:hypothetical protein